MQLRRRRSRNHENDDMDEPSHSSVHNQRVALSQNQPVSTGGYFVIPKQLCGLSQASAGVEFPTEDPAMAQVDALLLPDNVDPHMMQFLPYDSNIAEKDLTRKEAHYTGHDYYYQDPYDHDHDGNNGGDSHRYSSRVSFNEYPMGYNNNSSLVSRRQKKNKKMFILTVKTEHEEAQQTQPISMKGIVALETLRYRVQLNAFQNEKKKFSRNSSDLHDALWIFEVTLLISDGPTTLDQQFRIGNYYALQRGLGRPFDVMFKTPLEYFCELGRQISVFYHTRRDVFPQHLINLAVQYFDNMKVIVNERSPATANTTIVDHEREEALRAEELNHLRQHELWLLQNHPHLHPSWSMVYKAMKAQCSLAEVTSMSCVTLFRQMPSLYSTPKLSMTTVMIDDINSAYYSSHPGPPHPIALAAPNALSYAHGPPGSLQALVDHAEAGSAGDDHVNEAPPNTTMEVDEVQEQVKPQADHVLLMPKQPVVMPQTSQKPPQAQFPVQMPKPIQRPVSASATVPNKALAVAAAGPITAPVLPLAPASAPKPVAAVKTVHFQPLPQGSSEHGAKHGAGKAMKAVNAMNSGSSSTSTSPAAPAGKITLSEALKFIAQSSTSATATAMSRTSTSADEQPQPITQAIIAASAAAPTSSVRGRKPGSRAQGSTERFTPALPVTTTIIMNASAAESVMKKTAGMKRKLVEGEKE